MLLEVGHRIDDASGVNLLDCESVSLTDVQGFSSPGGGRISCSSRDSLCNMLDGSMDIW